METRGVVPRSGTERTMAQLLNINPDAYHARPGFSSSVAKVVLAQSLLHAKSEHDKAPTKLMDRGAALHTMILGRGARLACLPYKDWRTDAAKESRDKTRAAGLVPLLHEDYTEYQNAAKEIRNRLDEAGHFLSDDAGQSEAVIEWDEPTAHGPVLCRCMMDWVSIETGEIFEVKIVDDAHPDSCQRTAENLGYSISCAAYIRALLALRPELAGQIRFRFLFCEPAPPYGLHDPEPDIMFLESGERKWLSAVERWGNALKTGRWPHYEDNRYISRPRWALAREGIRRDEW